MPKPTVNVENYAPDSLDELAPVTVIHVPDLERLDYKRCESYLEEWMKSDDILSPEFAQNIVFALAGRESAQNAPDWLESAPSQLSANKHCLVLDKQSCPSQGVYIVYQGRLCEVQRLYEDVSNAFTLSFRQKSDGSYVPLGLGGTTLNRGVVAVKSRFGHQKSNSRPLLGYRIAVKDQYSIKGFKNSLGSKSWLDLYPPANKTAPSIQRLIDLGGQIVGLTQLCSLHQYQEPAQCVDFQDPWNPRGDGYQSPSGGSSGQASAVASYDWLDIAIASDSSLSGRVPAQANGCFGIRPTWGAVTNEGTWDGIPMFDTPSFMGRDLAMFREFANIWYGDKLKNSSAEMPRAILCFQDVMPEHNKPHMQIFHQCLEELQSYLGTKARWLSLERTWDENPPALAKGESLRSFFNPTIVGRITTYLNWHNKIRPFYESYQNRFGKKPFFAPPNGIHLWDGALGVTPEQHREAMTHISVYRDWLFTRVLKSKEMNTLAVMPLIDVQPNYRDEWKDPQGGKEPFWGSLMLAPMTGCPELVVPAGEIPFQSRISGNVEYLPVAISLLGLPGSDLNLIDEATAWLKHVGRPTKVRTGSRMFQDAIPS